MSLDPVADRAREAAYRRLGTRDARCLTCGEADPICLELHHIAGRAYDATLVAVCRNCHRSLSDPTATSAAPVDPPLMERVGHLLIGLADLMAVLVERLRAFGRDLLTGATVCPWPYGWVGAVAQ